MRLRWKVLLPLTVFSLLLACYLWGSYLPRSLENIEDTYQQATERHLDSVIEGLIPLMLGHNLDTIFENLDALRQKNGDWISIELTDTDGRRLYPLQTTPLPTPQNDDLRTLTRKISHGGTELGTLSVKVDFAPLLRQPRRRNLELLTVMLALMGLFIAGAAWVLEGVVIRPVRELSLAAKQLARGNFDVPLKKGEADEVGELVDRFAAMRDAILGYQTELLERSRVLMRNERNLAEAQRMAHLGSFELDFATGHILWSEECYRIFGMEQGEDPLTLDRFMELVHPDDRDCVLTRYRQSVEEKRCCDILHRIVRQTDGAIRHIHEHVEQLFDPEGEVMASRGTAHDITEITRAEEELRVKNVLLSTQQETSLDGILAVDERGRIISSNGRFAEIWGVPTEVLAAGSYEILLGHLTGKIKEPELFLATLEHLASHRDEKSRCELGLKDGRILDQYSSAMVDQNGRSLGRVWYFRDVSERHRLEEQLRQSQKMESIGTFAGGIAHDFNNILTAIVGYGTIALMKSAPEDPRRGDIEQMLEATEKAAHLTKDLLLFCRKQVSEKKLVDMNDIIRGTEKFLQRVIGEDIECRAVLAPEALPVMGDPHQLEQVLMNFATNARDAMEGGGLFTIATGRVHFDEEFVAAHGYGRAGEYVLVTVSDTGRGMDRETREQIFDPFFTTKEVGKGTGLGLAVVYGIIRDHDGFVNVYSELGEGTTFRLYLPYLMAPVEEEKPQAEQFEVRGTETILLAEDDETVRALTSSVLAEFGYRVIVATDGQEAVELYRENRDRIALLLFDLVMPRKTGKDAYDEIRAIDPGVRVLFSSGYAPDMVRQKMLIDEKVPMVVKPVSPLDLLKKVRETLDRDTA
ncbi:hypothetical protein GMSM_23880 [Geomonas sp. Red276]